jgi:glycine cleavage system H protein
MSVPAELIYTEEHEWGKRDGDVLTIGITDYAQGELGDIVYVELPTPGEKVNKGDAFGNIEAVKAVSDLYSPISGEVVEVNGVLADKPEQINQDPYGAGWMIKVKMDDSGQLDDLLDAAAYEGLI